MENIIPFPKVDASDVRLAHPFSALVCGMSSAGKTSFILKLIRHRDKLISPSIQRIIYSYAQYQKAFDELIARDNVEFVLGTDFKTDPEQNTLLVIDDQLLKLKDLPLAHLFSVGVHHSNLSVIFVTHNLFHQDAQFRLASLNAHYFILFKSPRGVGQINHLARQLFTHDPVKSRRLVRAYTEATREPYTYLVLDLKPNTDDAVRLRSHILPTEGARIPGWPDGLTKSYPL